MKRTDIIQILPIGILTIISLYSIFQVITIDFIFSGQQYFGLLLLGVSLVLFFTNRRFYKYLFGITLLLSLFNLIGFTTTMVTMNFIFIPIQLLIVPIFMIFLWINKEQLKPKIQSIFGTSEEQLKTKSNSKIEGFKRRFENLSDDEIESKLNEDLLPEALEALREIREARY